MYRMCQNDGATRAVISEGLRFLSPSLGHACPGQVVKGGVCSSPYNGTFVPGHGENAATETADSSVRPCTTTNNSHRPALSSSYTPTSHPISFCACSSLHSPLRLLMCNRRQVNDWTRPRRLLSRLGNGTS